MYTDRQRELITKESYKDYEFGDPVQIGSKGEEITIGYVAEVERSGSGFKAYVINEALLHDRIYNYVDPLDIVGIGYHPGEGAVGQVFRINTVKSSKSGLEALVDQHMFGGYTYDDYDNMIDKDGFPVHLNPIKPLDINGDGKRDIMLNVASTTPRNLFLSSGRISAIGAKDIKLDSLIKTNQRIWNQFFFFILFQNPSPLKV